MEGDDIIEAHTMFSILKREAYLCYGFVRRDLGTGLLPVPAFALASLLYRLAPRREAIVQTGCR